MYKDLFDRNHKFFYCWRNVFLEMSFGFSKSYCFSSICELVLFVNELLGVLKRPTR